MRWPSRERSLLRGALVAALLVSAVALPACSTGHTCPSLATVPAAWRRTNPWGPEANAARAAGTLKPVWTPPALVTWEEFGRRHLEDGDVLLRRGLCCKRSSRAVSNFVTTLCDTPFSHAAVVRREGSEVLVYDAMSGGEGMRRIPFSFWSLDTTPNSLVVLRLAPEHRPKIPAALAYLEDVYRRQVPFDMGMRLGDDRLYCTELIEKAFRSAGVALSEPVPVRDLPGYPRHAALVSVVAFFLGTNPSEPIYSMGNPHYGLFASPHLRVVHSDVPPAALASRSGPRNGSSYLSDSRSARAARAHEEDAYLETTSDRAARASSLRPAAMWNSPR